MNEFLASMRRVFSQPAFIVVAIVLFLAGSGLNGATRLLQLHFRKLPVPLARPLTAVPDRLGPWQMVSIDAPLSHDFQEALATDKYIFRDYVDTRLLSPEELAQFKDKSPEERRKLAWMLQLKKPGAVVNLSLTYYTGLADTVAHIPDRCYVADGYEPKTYEVVAWDALKARPGKENDEKLRFIVFEDTTPEQATLPKQVAYFFQCNGGYTNDPLGVRKKMAYLFEQYGYYMKIETQTINLPPDQSARVMNEFLTHVLPEAEKCLADWEKFKSTK